jgi:nucleoside phosphorylase
MTSYREKAELWHEHAQQNEKPLSVLYDHGMLVMTAVLDRSQNVSAEIDDEGHYVIALGADPMRKRIVNYEVKQSGGQTAFVDEKGVTDSTLRGTLTVRQPHFEESIVPEVYRTCRFTVKRDGTEHFETRCNQGMFTSSFTARTSPAARRSHSATRTFRSPSRAGAQPQVNALVFTALMDELDAVKAAGEYVGVSWQRVNARAPRPYYCATFDSGNVATTVALACATDMGAVSTASQASILYNHLSKARKPTLLAMPGICAGHPNRTSHGDVVVAERVFRFDEGKREVIRQNPTGAPKETILLDLTTWKIEANLKHAVHEFAKTWCYTGDVPRPKSIDHQTNWMLWMLYDHEMRGQPYPRDVAGVDAECRDWDTVALRAEQLGWVEVTSRVTLTADGRRVVEREKALRPAFHGDPDRAVVHIGAMGTSSFVQKDAELFFDLQPHVRTTLAVDMEAEAIARIAYDFGCRFLVVKSVVDFATLDKDDKFRTYASATSADFLLKFLASGALRR